MTDQPPVMQLNIAETVNVLEGLDLYVLAPGNANAIRVEDHESCFKFHVTCTNTSNGERTKEKFALHGRLQSRKGVGIDHKFVVDQFEKTLKQYLAEKSMIVSDDLPMGSTVVHAIYRHTFAAGSRVGSYANGVGVFSQPIETNFVISVDEIGKLAIGMEGNYTLAVVGDDLIKFYLGEEPPVWGYKHEEKDVWRPIKKRPTPAIISACLDHFTQFVCEDNKHIEVYANDRHAELVELVAQRQMSEEQKQLQSIARSLAPPVETQTAVEKPNLLKRVASAIGMGAIQG